jgi:heme/copper-type cytochrome/quinol oxidase subunit 3
VHFWGSLATMNCVFLPMFAMGLMGVNRRLYDGGLQYAHAQPALSWNVSMTWSAVALGFFQIPFLINVVLALWRGRAAPVNPWNAITLEWQPVREKTRHTEAPAVRLGIWLFLASEAMPFASLFAAYVLLRTGSPWWPEASGVFDLSSVAVMTILLFASTALLAIDSEKSWRLRLAGASLLAISFVALKLVEYNAKIESGSTPSTNLLLASWFVLTGVHAAHVLGGVAANVWVAAGDVNRPRMSALRLYWYFVDVVWLLILAGLYLV